MKRRVLSILILGANLLNVAAQNMTSSPVSMFGLGELSTGFFNGIIAAVFLFRFGCQRVLSEIFTVRSEQSFS